MAFVNDSYRGDGHEDAICLTVTRYQAPMFRKCLRNNPRENWVMLVIDPAVLWEKPCLFCDGNASSSRVKNTQRNLSTAYAFRAMFDDCWIPKLEDGTWVNVSKRGQDGTPDWVPTDAQAEVLVKARIPCDRILGVWVESDKQGERIAAMLQTVSESVRPDLIVGKYSFENCDGA
ncbi:hypothetical protein GCM10011345_38110 [Gemmobacter megaterium]|nr:hypothetical protein GCM10011345_38110 [Gemmobacter megaterium]